MQVRAFAPEAVEHGLSDWSVPPGATQSEAVTASVAVTGKSRRQRRRRAEGEPSLSRAAVFTSS
jgi:hypothetical protein